MTNRQRSIIFGILLGYCLSLFLWTLFFEHTTLFVLFPIFPIAGISIGCVFGWYGSIPPLKIQTSLLIFVIVIGISAGLKEARGLILRERRESTAAALSSLYPESAVLSQEYNKGNGMEIPPNVSTTIESDESYENIIAYYDSYFRSDGWVRQGGWRKRNCEIFLHKINSQTQKTVYELNIDFLGWWVTNLIEI